MGTHQEATAAIERTEAQQGGVVRRAVGSLFRHSDCTIGATTVAVLVLSALS